MKTSTEANPQAAAPKPPKVKGPIRTEAVVPVGIIVLVTFLYFHFLFDGHLRRGAEWTATYIHGAEVNIGSIKTSVFGGSFVLNNLQVTDKEMPVRNLIQIGEIRFGFLWDALLRVKFVVNNAGITNIQVYSPRKTPGYVKPPEPPSNKPSEMAKLQNKVLDQTQDQFDGNVLGDLAALLEGTDSKDLLKNIQGDLKAEAHIKALSAELKEKEKAWKERIDKLPQKDDLEKLKARAKALKFDSKNPKQFADDIKEAGKIAKEADAIVDEIRDTSKTLKGDVDKYNTEFRSLDDMIKQDIADIEKRVKIPNLDLQDFSKNVFGSMFAAKLVSLQKYMAIARKYMPPKKTAEQKAEQAKAELVPPARGAGKNYRFPVTTGYPLFWLKKAEISSKSSAEGFSGDIRGLLTDVSSDPHIVANPLVLDVSGDFPKSEVMNTKLVLTVDHRNDPVETLVLSVGQFPVRELDLVKSSGLGLKLKQAGGSSVMNVKLQNEQLDVDLQNEFKQAEYDLTASKTAKEAISGILAGIPVITLNAHASGSWEHLDIGINSNLGKELADGLKKYVKAKVDEMKQQVKNLVDAKIKGEKDKLTEDFDKVKNQVDGTLKSKTSEMETAKSDLKSSTKSQQGGSKDKLKNDLKEKGKKLLKGFKF